MRNVRAFLLWLAVMALLCSFLASCTMTYNVPATSMIPGSPKVGAVTTKVFLHKWNVEGDIRAAAAVGGITCMRGVFFYHKQRAFGTSHTTTVAGE